MAFFRAAALAVSVLLGAFVVLSFHDFLLFDSCLDLGGHFNEETNICISGETFEEFYTVLTWPVLAIYVVLALFTFVFSWMALNKLFKILRFVGSET